MQMRKNIRNLDPRRMVCRIDIIVFSSKYLFIFLDMQSLHLENLVHCGHLLSNNGNPGKMDNMLPLNA